MSLTIDARTMTLKPASGSPHPDCAAPKLCSFPCRWPECRDESKYWREKIEQSAQGASE